MAAAAFCRIKRSHFLVSISFKQLFNLYPPNNNSFIPIPFAKRNHFPFCSTPTSQRPENSLPLLCAEDSRIVDKLVHIFNMRLEESESQELELLGSKISTLIVGLVLEKVENWEVAQTFFNWASNQDGYYHNCDTFYLMAGFLSCARQIDSLRMLVSDVVKSQCHFTPYVLGSFIRFLDNQGLVKEANELFDHLKNSGLCDPNSFTYKCLLNAISKEGDVGLIGLRFKEMHSCGWQLDKHALTPIETLLASLNRMHERDSGVLSVLLFSFIKWDKLDKAFEFIERIEDLNISINAMICSILINGFVIEGRTDKALQLLDKLRKMGCVLDVSVYGVLIEQLFRNQEIEKAMQLYLEMIDSGICPDIKIVYFLMESLCSERNIIRVAKVWEI